MKLVDVFVLVNGHLLGPFISVLPQAANGEDVIPDDGDEVQILIRPHVSGPTTKARTKLQRS